MSREYCIVCNVRNMSLAVLYYNDTPAWPDVIRYPRGGNQTTLKITVL